MASVEFPPSDTMAAGECVVPSLIYVVRPVVDLRLVMLELVRAQVGLKEQALVVFVRISSSTIPDLVVGEAPAGF